MSAEYRILAASSFEKDVERLEEEVVQHERASKASDEDSLFRFRDAVTRALPILTIAPQTCRRSEADRSLRELVIPFGQGGCVVLFAVRDADVLLLAVRDQHENDYR